MASIATEELTLAEECYALAVEYSFSKKELNGLKRALAKRTDAEIFASICRIGASSSSADIDQAIGMLYSLTEPQLAELEGTLKLIQGWD
jgi:hypothetical protein